MAQNRQSAAAADSVPEPASEVVVAKGLVKTRVRDAKKIQASRRERLVSILSPLMLLVVWELVSRFNLIDVRFFPPPSAIAEAFVTLTVNGVLWASIKMSMTRIIVGFLLGGVPGLLLGLTMGLFRWPRVVLEPMVYALYPIPKIALMPLILIIFGIGEESKWVTIAIGVFFMVLINTMAGVQQIDKIYIDVAKNYGANRKDFYTTIALPGALPLIFAGLKLGMGMALLLIVAAEMIAAKSGIGYMIWQGYATFWLEQMYVGLILMAFFGYLFSMGLNELERWIIPWKSSH